MHPIVSRLDREWLAYVLFGAAGVMIGSLPLRRAGADSSDAAWFTGWGVALMFLAMHSWYIARYVPIAKTSFVRFLATAVTASVLVSGIWVGAGWLLASALASWAPTLPAAFERGWPMLWRASGTAFLCVLFLMYALDAADEGEAAARRALESDVSSRDAELRALRAQVNPHFLFNCLHSISSMTSRDPEGARRMCLELADFFRASVRAGAEPRVPLATELQLLRRYLDIEQVRFGDRLSVSIDDPRAASDVMVPPLLLQPLGENAVRHGIATLVEGGAIRVGVAESPGRVEITVENPFDPDGRRAGTGVGLANVRDRLTAAYRGRAAVRASTSDSTPPIFTVTLSLPAEMEAASS